MRWVWTWTTCKCRVVDIVVEFCNVVMYNCFQNITKIKWLINSFCVEINFSGWFPETISAFKWIFCVCSGGKCGVATVQRGYCHISQNMPRTTLPSPCQDFKLVIFISFLKVYKFLHVSRYLFSDHMCTCNMSCKLTSRLKTLITLIAIEWFFANMSTLV